MITLHQFRPAWGLPNPSPFCMKVEVYLRLTNIPYITAYADVRKAPKGKLPYISDDDTILADSGFIIDYLEAVYGNELDAWLSAEQLAIALAMRRLIEENLYWTAVHARWIEPDGWEVVKTQFFEFLPPILRHIVPGLVQKQMAKQLRAQGMGRHSPEEIYRIGIADLTALSAYLSDKPYFMGDKPATLDATAYAFLANLIWEPFDSPLKRHALQLPNILAYCDRMRTQYFPEN